MKKFLWVLALACTTTLPTIQAQETSAPEQAERHHHHHKGHHHHHRPKLTPEHRAELKEHFRTNMLPVLTEKHQAFDAQLSSEDLQFLNQKRAEAANLHEQKKSIREERKALREAEKSEEEIRAIIQPKMDGLRQQHQTLAETLQPFIERNKALIETTMEELKPYHEKWREERRAIHEKYRPADAPRPEDRPKHSKDKDGKCEHSDKKHGDKPDRKERKIIKFLLWNGENMDDEAPEDNDEGLSLFDQPMQVEVFPNPAVDNTTMTFELENAAKQVTVTVTNIKGQVVRQVNLGGLNTGKHNTTISVNDLPSGQYIYTLDIDGQQQTKSVVVQKP